MFDSHQPSLAGNGARGFRSPLLSKHGLIVTALAGELLERAPNERLFRVHEYAKRLDASVGTVQSALDYLQEAGAAQLEARGRLGTFARELNYPLLWSLAQARPLIGAMPLPSSRRLEGLATGIRTYFARRPLDLELRFMRGSTSRLQAIASGECDWALVSRFAAETAAQQVSAEIVLLLGQATYIASHVLLISDRLQGLQHGLRVGIDLQSPDHAYLVRSASSGKQVQFIAMNYSQGLQLIACGIIDATVWNKEDLPAEVEGVVAVPLEAAVESAVAPVGEAAFVVAHGNRRTGNVLRAVLEVEGLLQVQQDVVQLLRIPAY